MKINTLTIAEENIMQIIWKLDSPFMKDIMDAFPEPKPHQNTVSTYLKILVDKEFLKIEKVGRINKYISAISFEEYKNYILKHFLENYFSNDAELLVKTLIKDNFLSETTLQNMFGKNLEITEKPMPEKTIEEAAISEYLKRLTEPDKKKSRDKKKKTKKNKK
ncbi:MAG: BlaI/MecI/CopY family transcriptional regulator [Cruoricaptor ignavus]|nr:BlaI/MecI/CopY family transcriptional regulator [Cruoricaptor ignavus]